MVLVDIKCSDLNDWTVMMNFFYYLSKPFILNHV